MGGKKDNNTFSWCHRCDSWRWDWKIRKQPVCECGARMQVGARRIAWAQGPPPPWRSQPPPQQQHQHQYRSEQGSGRCGVEQHQHGDGQTTWAADISGQDRRAVVAFLGELAAKNGGDESSAGALRQFAASLQPAPVVAPTPKKLLDLATSAHRQAIKSKQDLERRQGHLETRRAELRVQIAKVEAEYSECGEQLAAAEADVKAKVVELEKARDATTEPAKPNKEEAQNAAKEAMDVEAPPPFDPVDFAKTFFANLPPRCAGGCR